MYITVVATFLWVLFLLVPVSSLRHINGTKDDANPQPLFESAGMVYPLIASSPIPPKDSELYQFMGQLDILESKNKRVFYLVSDDELLFEYGTFLPEITIEKEKTEALHETHETLRPYKSAYRALNDYPTISCCFSCYRSLAGSYQTMTALKTKYPSLVEVIDIGPSYLKSIGSGGHEIQALKLTNTNSMVDKSHLFITCALHVREIATAESCARFAENILSLYGSDADMTWILDYTEIHIVMQANPDGREDEESQLANGVKHYRRKNMNFNPKTTSCTSDAGGVDLNRNFPHSAWGTVGVSSNLCSPVYPGKSAGSEPEVDAIVKYVQSVLPPGTNTVDGNGAYNSDSTGVFMDIHSYGEDFFYPWGNGDSTPNQEAFVTMAKKMSSYTSPSYTTDNDTYGVSGDSTDWVYSSTGVLAYTMELGNNFYQSCSYFESNVLPSALGALLYAARVSKAPYLYSKGPDVMKIVYSSNSENSLDVTVKASDSKRAQGYTTGSQDISEINLYLNTHPYDSSATIEMAANSGFTSSTETTTLSIDVSDLADGNHTVYIQAKDTDGTVGPVYASHFTVPLDYPNEVIDDDDGDCAMASKFLKYFTKGNRRLRKNRKIPQSNK